MIVENDTFGHSKQKMKIIPTSFPSILSSAVLHTALVLLVVTGFVVDACSDVLVTPGASTDGSAMIAYNADDAALYGVLYHYPATQNNTSEDFVQIYDWDSGVSK